MAGQLLGIGFTLLAAVSLAAQSLAVRLGTRTQSVVSVLAIMFAVNLLVLLPLAGVLAYPEYSVSLRALGAFTTAGVLGSLVARLCYFVGIARLGASRTEPLKGLFPLVAVVTAVVVLDEQLSLTLLVGVGLLVAGGLLVTLEARASPVTATGRRFWIDVLFPLVAALALGIDPIFTKLGFAEGTSPWVGLTVRMLAATGGFTLYFAWRTVRQRDRPSIGLNRWILVASGANTVYLLAYYAALARTRVAIVTPLLGTSTLFVVAGAAAFLQHDERVTWRLAGAAVVVVIGAVFVVQG